MRDLRDAQGRGRLGWRVVGDIERWLDGEELGWLPQDLRGNQEAVVVLYARGTLPGDLVQAACELSELREQLGPDEEAA